MMKPTAIIINVARGGIIDEKALAEALNNKVIAGAGLDVFSREPLHESPLYALSDNYSLVAAPHTAWAADAANPMKANAEIIIFLIFNIVQNLFANHNIQNHTVCHLHTGRTD